MDTKRFPYCSIACIFVKQNTTNWVAMTQYLMWLQALKKVPGVNSSWHGDFIRQYHNIDISIAVQTPNGLMVPVVRDSHSKGLTEIGAAVKALAGKVSHLLRLLLCRSSRCLNLLTLN